MARLTLESLKSANLVRWTHMVIRSVWRSAANDVAGQLSSAKSRYQMIGARTGIPWAIVAVIHEREASQSWAANLAQGDPWNRKSIHAPKGRGPFKSWEDAAIDALSSCPPYLAKNRDWAIGGALAALEEFNGLGYFKRKLASPYLWSGTDQYKSGKFIADGHFDPDAIDKQIGCATLLRAMMAIDPSIRFANDAATAA